MLVLFIFAGTLCGCGYNKFVPIEPDVPDTQEPDYITIAQLTARHSEGGATMIAHEAIKGRVISDDKEGNFYKTLVLQDTTGSLEMRFGVTNLESMFPRNSTVSIAVRGLTLGRSVQRNYQLGFASNDEQQETAYIPTLGLIQRYILNVESTDVDNVVKPLVVKIDKLTPDMAGRLIRVEGLEVERPIETCETWAIPAEMSHTGFPISQELKCFDSRFLMVHVYTSGYASFAGDTIPKKRVNLTGILFMKNAKEYRIQMRSRGDIEK